MFYFLKLKGESLEKWRGESKWLDGYIVVAKKLFLVLTGHFFNMSFINMFLIIYVFKNSRLRFGKNFLIHFNLGFF
jgi:hypothetical protein